MTSTSNFKIGDRVITKMDYEVYNNKLGTILDIQIGKLESYPYPIIVKLDQFSVIGANPDELHLLFNPEEDDLYV